MIPSHMRNLLRMPTIQMDRRLQVSREGKQVSVIPRVVKTGCQTPTAGVADGKLMMGGYGCRLDCARAMHMGDRIGTCKRLAGLAIMKTCIPIQVDGDERLDI